MNRPVDEDKDDRPADNPDVVNSLQVEQGGRWDEDECRTGRSKVRERSERSEPKADMYVRENKEEEV